MMYPYTVDKKLDVFCEALRTPVVGYSVTMRVADALLKVAREVVKEEHLFFQPEMSHMLILGERVQMRLRSWPHVHMLPQIVSYCLSGEEKSHMDALVRELLRFAPVEDMKTVGTATIRAGGKDQSDLITTKTIVYDPKVSRKR